MSSRIRQLLHDVNNALTIILGQASTSMLQATTPRCVGCKHGYGDIVRAATNIRKWLEEAYQLSEENGQNSTESMRLKDRYEALLLNVKGVEEDYQLRVRVTINAEEECYVFSSVEVANAVLRKLVENASKARAKNVHVHYQEMPHYVQVTIHDDGAGMSPDHLESIGLFNGSGLSGGKGIRLVRELVNSVGGTVSWDSRLGVGTWVTINLRKSIRRKEGAEAPEDDFVS